MDDQYIIQFDLNCYSFIICHLLIQILKFIVLQFYEIMTFLQNFDRENDRYKMINNYKYVLNIFYSFLYSLINFIIVVLYLVNDLVYIIISLNLC